MLEGLFGPLTKVYLKMAAILNVKGTRFVYIWNSVRAFWLLLQLDFLKSGVIKKNLVII